jgi:hypothetical protein
VPEKVPSGLAARGRKLWHDVTKSHNLRPDQLQILLEYCREADLLDDLSAERKGAPITSRGSMGQEVEHPVLSALRQHRSTFTTMYRALALEDLDTSAADARTAAREGATALARARWSRTPA